jgi:hypothetical protein
MPEFYEARLTRLEKDVDDGDVRLDEPRRLTRQIQKATERIKGMFIERAVKVSRPPRHLKISNDSKIQAAWEKRHDEMVQEVAYLKQATEAVQGECGKTQAEIERVKRRLETSRTLTITREVPPKARRLSFFQRLVRAWRAGKWSVFWERQELIPQPARTTVEHLDQLLAEPLPATRPLEDLLAEARRSQDECRRLG